MTAHAMEEMAEDSLDILDVEHALFSGEVARIDKSDPRGTKYVVEGAAPNRQSAIGRRGGRTIYEYRTLSDYHSV